MTVLIFFLVIFLSLPFLKLKGQAWVKHYQTESTRMLSDQASSHLVYSIKPKQWLTFNLVEGTQQLKIISNAHIRKPKVLTLDDNWMYTLRYQLLNSDGDVITDKLYHQRSRLTSYRDEYGDMFFGSFYSGHSLTPLDGRLIKFSMNTIAQATTIRISFIQQNHEVEETSIRLYIPAKVSEHRLATMWLRMSDKHKETIAKHSVYPATLLSETEKINLLKHQWKPVGPVGVEGRDYTARTLYILKEIESEKLEETVLAAGLQIDSEHLGIISIPEQGGQLSLQLTAFDGSALTSPVDVQLNWFGRTREQRWQRQIQGSADHVLPSPRYPVQGGLLQIKTDQPVLVQAFLHTDDQQSLEITPKPLHITSYQAIHGIDYQVLHENNQPTAIRIDIRQVLGKTSSAEKTELEYQWFNPQQQLVNSGFLSISSTPSVFDRLTGDLRNFSLSDPIRYYLTIPDNVSRLRLISKRDDLLVNTYNQPYQYKKIQRVPENSYILLDKKYWYPTWFVLRPTDEKNILKQQWAVRIAAQYRPPEDDPMLLADQYIWEDYRPLEPTNAHYILTKMSYGKEYRDEALSSVFCQLQPNQVNPIGLKNYGDLPRLSPELIYIRPRKSAFDFSVLIGQKQHLSMSTMGQQGSFRLSNLTHGPHNFTIQTQDNGKWLMNMINHCQSEAFLKRRVFELNNQTLTFIYNNQQMTDQTFSAQFYTAYGNDKRSVIQVSIEAMQQQPMSTIKKNWTFTRRSYDIRAIKGAPSVVLNKHGYNLNSGERFFIPFKQDMPKGQYQIKMTLMQGAPGYVALSQLKPGIFEQRRFYRETND